MQNQFFFVIVSNVFQDLICGPATQRHKHLCQPRKEKNKHLQYWYFVRGSSIRVYFLNNVSAKISGTEKSFPTLDFSILKAKQNNQSLKTCPRGDVLFSHDQGEQR